MEHDVAHGGGGGAGEAFEEPELSDSESGAESTDISELKRRM